MDLLEVPLDAAAFRLYSLPAAAAVGSAWACLALLAAAAVGLLGFRAVGYKLPENHPSPSSPTTPPPPPPEPIPAQLPRQKSELAPVAVPAVRQAGFHLEEASSSSSPKARFMAYYCPAAGEIDDDDASYGEEDEVHRRAVAARWDGVKCAADVGRRGDLGWYRYQDMTALNGSVVKLWERRDGHSTASSFCRRQ